MKRKRTRAKTAPRNLSVQRLPKTTTPSRSTVMVVKCRPCRPYTVNVHGVGPNANHRHPTSPSGEMEAWVYQDWCSDSPRIAYPGQAEKRSRRSSASLPHFAAGKFPPSRGFDA